jgi:hypothetical protein
MGKIISPNVVEKASIYVVVQRYGSGSESFELHRKAYNLVLATSDGVAHTVGLVGETTDTATNAGKLNCA